MRRAKIAAIVGVILVVCTLQIVAQENANGLELTFQLGHSGAVQSVAFSPDGRYMLTGSVDGTVMQVPPISHISYYCLTDARHEDTKTSDVSRGRREH